MRGIRKCPTIIYHLKNTVIPVYRGISWRHQIIDNFRKIPTVRIVCSALADSLSQNCVIMILYGNFLPLDVVVMLLALIGVLMYADDLRYIIPSLLIPRYFSDTGIPRMPRTSHLLNINQRLQLRPLCHAAGPQVPCCRRRGRWRCSCGNASRWAETTDSVEWNGWTTARHGYYVDATLFRRSVSTKCSSLTHYSGRLSLLPSVGR